MIDAKELRLSNWVLDSEGVERQVTVISAQGRVFLPPVKYVDRMPKIVKLGEDCSTDLIHPIHLTPEVLEACDWNGYKSLYIGSYFNLDTYGHLYYGSDYTGINVDYLHQLQNLYFDLCGQELEYKPKV